MMAQLEKSNLFLSTEIWIYKQSSSTKIKNSRFDSVKSAERMQIVPIGWAWHVARVRSKTQP